MSASRKFSIAEIYIVQTRRAVSYVDVDTASRLTKMAVSISMSVKRKLFVRQMQYVKTVVETIHVAVIPDTRENCAKTLMNVQLTHQNATQMPFAQTQ